MRSLSSSCTLTLPVTLNTRVAVTLSGVEGASARLERSRRVSVLREQRFLTALHSFHSFRSVRNDGIRKGK